MPLVHLKQLLSRCSLRKSHLGNKQTLNPPFQSLVMLFSANCSGLKCEHDSSFSAFSLGLKKQSSQNTCNSGKISCLMNYAPTKHNHTSSQKVRLISIPMQKNSRKQNILFYYWDNFPPFIHPKTLLAMNWKTEKIIPRKNSCFPSFTKEIQEVVFGNYRSRLKKANEDSSNSLTSSHTDLSLGSAGTVEISTVLIIIFMCNALSSQWKL